MCLFEKKNLTHVFVWTIATKFGKSCGTPKSKDTEASGRPACPFCRPAPPRAPFPAPQNDLKKHLELVKNDSKKRNKNTPKRAPEVKKRAKKNTTKVQKKGGQNTPKIRQNQHKHAPQKNTNKMPQIGQNSWHFMRFSELCWKSWGSLRTHFHCAHQKHQKTAPKLGQNELKKTAQIIKKMCFFVICLAVFVDDFCYIFATFLSFLSSFCVPIEALLWS